MNAPEKEIFQLLNTYKTAAMAKDVDTFISLYAQEVVIYDMWSQWSYQGRTAWQNAVNNWFNSLGDEQVIIEITSPQLIIGQQLATIHALVTFKGLSAAGKELHAMRNRFTWVLKNQNGAWEILHEHSSAPINSETSKVILQ